MKPAVLLLAATAVFATGAVAETVPQTPLGWLAQMGDFRGNTLPVRAPENFIGFLHAATEPDFHQQRMVNMSEPAYWGRATDSMFSPGMIGNLTAVATPQTAFAWAQAMMDPRFYEALGTVMGDPGKWTRWSMASMAPASYQPFFKPFDPQLQARWQTEMQSPANWMAFFNPLAASPLAVSK
ncbi:MAG: hypothetical protein LDL16_10925 [Thiobacillus sp.]|nr:hypothetical protein [Thiobacillus sp.]